MVYRSIFLFFIVISTAISGCTTIPSKVPELLDKTADKMDTQAAWVSSEWESSITANNSSSKLLDLIQPVIANLDQSKLDADSKSRITKFLSGYAPVKQQLSDSISQKESPSNARTNIEQLSKSVRFANGYIKAVDENKRIEAVIDGMMPICNDPKSKGVKQ